MKYKVGDKVKIREDLDSDKMYGAWDCSTDMTLYGGRIATIKNCYDDSYYIDVDDKTYDWTDEMFEDINEVNDNEQARTVDVGFHLDYCGNKVIENVWQGGLVAECEKRSVFFTSYDCKNQYTLPLNAIDFIVPHED